MSYLKDYEEIKVIIDEIIGIDTQQGSNLKMALKKYFEMKPLSVKLVNTQDSISINKKFRKPMVRDSKMEEALERYTKNIKENIDKMKTKGEYCGIEG